MLRVAIFGSNGQLGLELARTFAARGHAVSAFDRQQTDIADAGKVEQALASCDAGLVLNAAAYNQVDAAELEPLASYQVNALAVRNLACACRQRQIKLVHFSTDYVFDGTAGRPYTEEDETHPLGAYAV